jgi:hypothetical protein
VAWHRFALPWPDRNVVHKQINKQGEARVTDQSAAGPAHSKEALQVLQAL